jgi:hypothetical protein
VAQLKLNADWVVLSACNTAGRGSSVGPCARLLLRRRPRAAALTLANRFEGGDPIGHIDVRHHDSNQTIGRAEALRRAMLAFAPPLSIEFQNHAAGAAREIRAN